MTDEQLAELKHWIATDQSDYAQCVREALAPTVQEFAKLVRRAVAFLPHRETMMARKLRRMARNACR